MKKICVLTGAGISAESGIKTFRDSDGLWEGHDVMEVASIDGWHKNPNLVLDFYNQRRAQLKEVKPNRAHEILAEWQDKYEVTIITQNVDNLHERAGSKNVIHLHGELLKVRSTKNPELVYDWTTDCNLGDLCENESQLRPDIVWFGEEVPLLELAASIVAECEILLIIGTSLVVYPAAQLMYYAPPFAEIIYIDKNPNQSIATNRKIKTIVGSASQCLSEIEAFI
ncbi:MAG: NAD-dependent deacylase [Saprospiraceae bacterium]|nr:NAD-dependent deacylase [Saprospiraceae bacterium]MBK9992865.1 NAD-dependent deacylase [Saprospiraceae bacterium]